MANMIQIAVAQADILLCQIIALPWKRIALSVVIAVAVIRIIRAVLAERKAVE